MSVKPKVLWYLSRQLLMLNRFFFFLSSVPERRGFSMEKVKKENASPPCFLSKDTKRIEILKINCNTS